MGYEVELYLGDSGRSYLSKGFLKQARKLAETNLKHLYPKAKSGMPILGIEPSAILSFRDEYKRFHLDPEQTTALADQSFLVEEFLAAELEAGRLDSSHFTKKEKEIKLHIHCHQKALSGQKITFDLLNLPENYQVSIIPSGCCGMAGSFGYEKEHYQVSMQVGELTLFPAVRRLKKQTVIAANGTSCRHQIKDGTDRTAKHPISILKEALVIN